MTFEEDLTKRRIDVAAFATGDPNRFAEWQHMYSQMHPNSFYVAVKMVINDVRRRFWLAEAIKAAPVPVTEAPAKPAARRAAIPVAAPKPTDVSTPEITDNNSTTAPTPPKARPVIRRPTTISTETPTIPELPAPAATPAPQETPAEVPKAPRARPVFRKPAITPENTTEERAAASQIQQDGTNLPVHTNPDPEVNAPQSPHPRPVIKRPAANLNSEDIIAKTEPQVITPVPETSLTPDATLLEEPTPKPPRPRPIFKRPAVVPTAEEIVPAPTEATDTGVVPTATEVTSETPVVPTSEVPPTTAPTEEPRKPPRPRPVFKRPAPPDNSAE